MIKKLANLLLFIVLSFSSGAQDVDELIASGNQSIKTRDFEAAVQQFAQAVEQSDGNAEALNGIIRAYTLSKEFKQAQKYVERAIEKYPNNAEFVLRWGIVLNLKGSANSAIDKFEQGLQMNPDDNIKLQLLMNKATAEMNTGRFSEAVEDYNQAVELSPRSTVVYNCRGLANYRVENYSAAVNDFTSAIDLDPEPGLPYYNRALAWLKQGDRQKACPDFQKACQLKIADACKRIVLECRR